MTCDRDRDEWCWFVEELNDHRYTASGALYHEIQGRTVTIIQAGESDD